MNLSGKSLYVGVCCYRHEMRAETCIGLMSLQAGCFAAGIDLYVNIYRDCPYVDLGKSVLVADYMLRHNQDYMLIIDSDMGFEFNDVARLMADDVKVVSGDYTTRSFPVRRIAQPPEGRGLTRCSLVPGGFLLIKREAFIQLEESFLTDGRERVNLLPGTNYHQFFGVSIDEQTKTYLGEDYTFCKNLTKAGIEIHCDFDVRVSHVGDYVFKLDRQTMAMSRMAEEYPRR